MEQFETRFKQVDVLPLVKYYMDELDLFNEPDTIPVIFAKSIHLNILKNHSSISLNYPGLGSDQANMLIFIE
ncbi:MAG: hypothetical protein GY786_07800 [Proteobacteria bacterium]|nr:hypothetical protein [Pseudomonadota bacterium]